MSEMKKKAPEVIEEPKKEEATEATKQKKVSSVTFRGPLNGIVWDASRGKALCKFENGIYRTSDAREIEIIRKYLHQHEADNKERVENMRVIEEKNKEVF